ncbi:unnamed protein product [Musa hybrid cultivar]
MSRSTVSATVPIASWPFFNRMDRREWGPSPSRSGPRQRLLPCHPPTTRMIHHHEEDEMSNTPSINYFGRKALEMETTRAESLTESHRCLLEMIAGALFGQEASGFIGHHERSMIGCPECL